MMLHNLGPNVNTLDFGDSSILFSYETAVAYRGPLGRFRTDARHSNATSRHLSHWSAKDWAKRPQAWFDGLTADIVMAEAKRTLGE